ncbi:hypothetical protein RM545_02155 [Zunongwangia sp. F260]|uniref:Uncharacterized protein n=1 Tax=Autumnicola lenta TaxID=3075593 RepID=A0ABU3CGL9_9FLAO|nr:hypothetical protein [Zunongwangia sp. F260]MDT0645480.1 hypothetical protein [Zunongwangia sp. F260]
MKKLMLILALVCSTGVFTSCREEKSGVERAADDIEDAADDVGDAVEDATN